MSLAEYAAGAKLRRVGARPPLVPYLVDVWRHRPFIYRLARFRIEAENGRSRLGMGWVILNPIIDAIVYGSVFGVLLGRDAIPGYYYIPFLVIGVFFFDYFSSCSACCSSPRWSCASSSPRASPHACIGCC